MYVGRGGYVGVVRQGQGKVHLGASLGAKICHQRRGPLGMIHGLLEEGGCDVLRQAGAVDIKGTGPMSAHRSRVAGHRVLAVGDACGFVEPFTGQGLAWAIRGAVEVAAILPARAENWRDEMAAMWQRRYEAGILQRHEWSWRLRAVLQRPALVAGCVRAARLFPRAAERFARHISGPEPRRN
jgi:flavin-dependent dehydrogenase